MIDDGAVIQYGIGSVPSAILSSLSNHRRLGIHSGMLTDDIIALIDSGVVTNETNRARPGITVGALTVGSERLSHYLHLNPVVELHPASNTHSARTLAQLDRLVAINSAIEVDLYGQVNAEMAGDRPIYAWRDGRLLTIEEPPLNRIPGPPDDPI
jgi:acyl-CoA hydrolase